MRRKRRDVDATLLRKRQRDVEVLIDDKTPWERDSKCRYVVAIHPKGLTLDQVGQLLGLTRERIRQIEMRAYEKILEHPEGRRLAKLLEDKRDSWATIEEGDLTLLATGSD